MSIEKATFVRLGGISLAAAGLCTIWLQQVWLQAQPPKQPLEVQKATDHLWVIMNAANGNRRRDADGRRRPAGGR